MEQAKELADSYRLLVHRRDMLRQQYEDSRSWFYTKDEIIYKLSQGAHEESERVQTSGTSNPVERTVLNLSLIHISVLTWSVQWITVPDRWPVRCCRNGTTAVSYTHLDVYKRQHSGSAGRPGGVPRFHLG